MPLLGPPVDRVYPVEEKPKIESNPFKDRWIKFYLDCPNWICPICIATNFGRNKYCAYCFGRNRVKTPRPDWYKENTYAEVYYGPKNGRASGE